MTQRLPPLKAQITGADLKNPSRYRGANHPTMFPVGDPPDDLDEAGRQAWYDFASELPWLALPDRAILHLAAILRGKVRSGVAGVNHLQVYSAVLSKLGATPVDFARLALRASEEDPSEFFV